jgi:hypothetical protein
LKAARILAVDAPNCQELNTSPHVAKVRVRRRRAVEFKKASEAYRARAAEIRAVLEWVRRPEYRTELLALVMKYERLAEEAERQTGGDQTSKEMPPGATPPPPGTIGPEGPSRDPMDHEDP